MDLGPVMLDLEGLTLTEEERDIIQHPLVGGIILFSRNYHSRKQLRALLGDIEQSSKRRLLIAVDQEGGRVQRFRAEFNSLPPLGALGELYDRDPRTAHQIASHIGWLMAAELLSANIDFSFAPVLDLDYGVSTVIGNRSFHRVPDVVAILATAYIVGMNKAGMAAVGKHFPGHGAVAADSHHDIPIDERDFATIYDNDIQPYYQLAADKLAGVMPAHVIYPKVDPNPAGFSALWLQKILRKQLRFKGAIFSDDLSMAGAAGMGSYAQRAELALAAGCDMILVCNQRSGALEVLDKLQHKMTPLSLERLTNLYGKPTFNSDELQFLPDWQQSLQALEYC